MINQKIEMARIQCELIKSDIEKLKLQLSKINSIIEKLDEEQGVKLSSLNPGDKFIIVGNLEAGELSSGDQFVLLSNYHRISKYKFNYFSKNVLYGGNHDYIVKLV